MSLPASRKRSKSGAVFRRAAKRLVEPAVVERARFVAQLQVAGENGRPDFFGRGTGNVGHLPARDLVVEGAAARSLNRNR